MSLWGFLSSHYIAGLCRLLSVKPCGGDGKENILKEMIQKERKRDFGGGESRFSPIYFHAFCLQNRRLIFEKLSIHPKN